MQKKMSLESKQSQLDAPVLVETFLVLFCIASQERNALKHSSRAVHSFVFGDVKIHDGDVDNTATG